MTPYPMVELRDVAEIIMGQSPAGEHYNTTGGGKPLITGSGQMGAIYPKPTQFSSSGSKVSKRGDLIMSIRASIGDLNWSDRDYFLGRGVAAIRAGEKLNAQYGWWALRAFRHKLELRATGSTFKQIRTDDLASLIIPLPPLEEQRRIAAILDQAEALRTKRKRTEELIDSIRENIFYEMFGDPRTNNMRLPTGTLGKLLTLRSGDFLPASQMDLSGTYAVYGGNGINGRHSNFMFREPVISIGRVGAYCGVVHLTEPMSWVTDNSLVVAHRDPSLSDAYLLEALRIADLNQYSSQSGQPLISGSRLSRVQILVPPLDRQIRFEAVLSRQARLMALGMKSADLSGQLFASLQHLAFTGAL